MLFNSYAFIFLFLPAFLIVWQVIARARPGSLCLWLLLASIIFYALWGLPWLGLLIVMVCINHFLGRALAWPYETPPEARAASGLVISRRKLLICSLVFNLLPLLWFKYAWFFVQNVALLFHADWLFEPPGLPLGISFYTFIQIAWLISVYRGLIQPLPLTQHAVFSACFPYIISGPIVRQEQIGWQLENLSILRSENLASGFTLFSLGLAKKIILADSIGFYANAVFNAAAKNWPISGLEAWAGSLCYTFQLYFDFSGYTDMALGLGLMVGLRLPENFNSPYKSTGIIDFWRRWHITLSSWLRDFLYIPLGGNRHGKPRQYANLFLTMLIGGAWHGAGWTFIAWGAMHGLMLCCNHFFRALIRGKTAEKICATLPMRILFIFLTFLCLNFCWVIFRADSLDAGLAIYEAMFSGPFFALPATSGGGAQAIANIFNVISPNHYLTNWQPFLLLALAFIICWCCPNSRQLLSGEAGFFAWRPNAVWAASMALLTFICLAMLSRQSTFLYFQF